jgi:hypothetical protein
MRTGRTEITYKELSIDTPNQDGNTLSESIPETDVRDIFTQEEENLMKSKVETILSFIKGRDAEVVKACYGIGIDKPLEVVEVAELFNVTPTRINQILRTSIKKMKVSYENVKKPEVRSIEIISASYGADDKYKDVTDKVVDMYLKNENIKVSNRLGGDPIPGTPKSLLVKYIYGEQILSKNFSEGSFVKF